MDWARLTDRTERKRIAAETDSSLEQGWTNILISALETPANRDLIGQTIASIATTRECEPVEVVFNLIEEEQGRVSILEMNQSGTNLRQTLSHPLSCVISDGFYVKGHPYPRLYGTLPLLLGEMSRERGWLTLAAAVRKITDKPACRFSMWWFLILQRSAARLHSRTLLFRPLASVMSSVTVSQSGRGIPLIKREIQG